MSSIRSLATRQTRRASPVDARDQKGQSLVEFALILTPLMLILLGIVQMGFVLNTYITISNAAREGGRAATIHVYDRTTSKAGNDTARAAAARTAVLNAMGTLSRTAPQFSTSDLSITYATPAGVTESDVRAGQNVTIRMTYHLDLIVPFIAAVLPKDGTGRLPMGAEVTMAINS